MKKKLLAFVVIASVFCAHSTKSQIPDFPKFLDGFTIMEGSGYVVDEDTGDVLRFTPNKGKAIPRSIEKIMDLPSDEVDPDSPIAKKLKRAFFGSEWEKSKKRVGFVEEEIKPDIPKKRTRKKVRFAEEEIKSDIPVFPEFVDGFTIMNGKVYMIDARFKPRVKVYFFIPVGKANAIPNTLDDLKVHKRADYKRVDVPSSSEDAERIKRAFFDRMMNSEKEDALIEDIVYRRTEDFIKKMKRWGVGPDYTFEHAPKFVGRNLSTVSAVHGASGILIFLKKMGVDFTKTTKKHKNVLHYVGLGKVRPEVVQELIDAVPFEKKKAFVNLEDPSSLTPLHWSVYSKNPKVTKILIAAGADTEIRTKMPGHQLNNKRPDEMSPGSESANLVKSAREKQKKKRRRMDKPADEYEIPSYPEFLESGGARYTVMNGFVYSALYQGGKLRVYLKGRKRRGMTPESLLKKRSLQIKEPSEEFEKIRKAFEEFTGKRAAAKPFFPNYPDFLVKKQNGNYVGYTTYVDAVYAVHQMGVWLYELPLYSKKLPKTMRELALLRRRFFRVDSTDFFMVKPVYEELQKYLEKNGMK